MVVRVETAFSDSAVFTLFEKKNADGQTAGADGEVERVERDAEWMLPDRRIANNAATILRGREAQT
jgi:hypothetical protein